eukprot:scaffold5061_cov378-Prasinococcus_capsulatus_cf.AAC.1
MHTGRIARVGLALGLKTYVLRLVEAAPNSEMAQTYSVQMQVRRLKACSFLGNSVPNDIIASREGAQSPFKLYAVRLADTAGPVGAARGARDLVSEARPHVGAAEGRVTARFALLPLQVLQLLERPRHVAPTVLTDLRLQVSVQFFDKVLLWKREQACAHGFAHAVPVLRQDLAAAVPRMQRAGLGAVDAPAPPVAAACEPVADRVQQCLLLHALPVPVEDPQVLPLHSALAAGDNIAVSIHGHPGPPPVDCLQLAFALFKRTIVRLALVVAKHKETVAARAVLGPDVLKELLLVHLEQFRALRQGERLPESLQLLRDNPGPVLAVQVPQQCVSVLLLRWHPR